jgi:hypothetical protein
MPHSTEDSNLQWCNSRVRHDCLFDCMK